MNVNDKSLLLVYLWKIGVPDWVKKTVWPLVIGNGLEITEQYYTILCRQIALEEKEEDSKIDPSILRSFQQLKEDFRITNQKVLKILERNQSQSIEASLV